MKVDATICKMSISSLLKIVRLERFSEARYLEAPQNLASIVNHALVLQMIRHKTEEALSLYAEALQIDSSCIIANEALAIGILSLAKEPRSKKWVRAIRLLESSRGEAQLLRLENEFFRFPIARASDEESSLLNYALFKQCISSDYYGAETLYQRALSLNPSSMRVKRNYTDFLRRRWPKDLYEGSGPSRYARSNAIQVYTTQGWAKMSTHDLRRRKHYYWYVEFRRVSKAEQAAPRFYSCDLDKANVSAHRHLTL